METVLKILQWFSTLTPTKMLIILLLSISGYFFYSFVLDYQSIKAEIAICSKTRAEFESIKNDFILVRASQDQIPMPRWIKNNDLKMIWVNKAYEEMYLIPKGITAAEYISNYDDYVFGHATGEQWRANDKYVLRTKRPITFTEEVNGMQITVVKYPFKVGEVFLGVGGIEIIDFK